MSVPDRAATLVRSFEQALSRLKGALARPRDEFMRDASIQRFEFTYEMFWKTLKAVSEEAGLEVASPRDSVRTGFALGFVPEDPRFFDMVRDRNLTSHTYREETAEAIYGRLPTYVGLMEGVLERLKKRVPGA